MACCQASNKYLDHSRPGEKWPSAGGGDSNWLPPRGGSSLAVQNGAWGIFGDQAAQLLAVQGEEGPAGAGTIDRVSIGKIGVLAAEVAPFDLVVILDAPGVAIAHPGPPEVEARSDGPAPLDKVDYVSRPSRPVQPRP